MKKKRDNFIVKELEKSWLRIPLKTRKAAIKIAKKISGIEVIDDNPDKPDVRPRKIY